MKLTIKRRRYSPLYDYINNIARLTDEEYIELLPENRVPQLVIGEELVVKVEEDYDSN